MLFQPTHHPHDETTASALPKLRGDAEADVIPGFQGEMRSQLWCVLSI